MFLFFPRDQFVRANGYPNIYFGWGGEYNEMATRQLRPQKISPIFSLHKLNNSLYYGHPPYGHPPDTATFLGPF